jgi:hypothetical protein
MLFVFAPFTSILSAIHVDIGSPAVCLIVEPLSFVDIAIRMNESAPSVCHIVLPVPLIFAAVFPDLDTTTMTEAFLCPLTLINGSVIKLVRLSLDKF